MVELGTGNYPGTHIVTQIDFWEQDSPKRTSEGDRISRTCHQCTILPWESVDRIREFAKAHHEVHRKTVQLASELGVGIVINFSGCPGDGPNATKPNWVTCAWPRDNAEILEWQWNECVIPYWREEAKFAKDHNVKIAFEMHPGFCVYNVDTLLKTA
jgi:sugar phosphate isomerase/epimerase